MKILSWFIGLLLAVIVVLFALSNRGSVTVGLWPFEDGLALPLYLAVLLPLVAGFFLGFGTAGVKGLKHRRSVRRYAKRVATLEQELGRAHSSTTPAEVPPAGDRTPPP